jgi:Fic family protein
MDSAQFTDRSPGTLATTLDGVTAFVPDPVPKTIDLDLGTVRLLARAENALGHLNGSAGRLVNPLLVGSPLLHREAILSSRIEGTITTPEELVLFEIDSPHIAKARVHEEETREVRNYIRAMQHGLSRLKELPVCLRLVRELHRELMAGVRGDRERPGEFRTVQNYIGAQGGGTIDHARFVPPPVAELDRLLADLERALQPDYSPDMPTLVRLALVHYQFEAVHPFRDGNGRVGRLLIPLLLCEAQRLREPHLYLSS